MTSEVLLAPVWVALGRMLPEHDSAGDRDTEQEAPVRWTLMRS